MYTILFISLNHSNFKVVLFVDHETFSAELKVRASNHPHDLV